MKRVVSRSDVAVAAIVATRPGIMKLWLSRNRPIRVVPV
jgi:hypothetical protein